MERSHLHQVPADLHVAPAAPVSLARIVEEEPTIGVGALPDERWPTVTKEARRGFCNGRYEFGRTDKFSYPQLFGGPGEVANRVVLEAGAASCGPSGTTN